MYSLQQSGLVFGMTAEQINRYGNPPNIILLLQDVDRLQQECLDLRDSCREWREAEQEQCSEADEETADQWKQDRANDFGRFLDLLTD